MTAAYLESLTLTAQMVETKLTPVQQLEEAVKSKVQEHIETGADYSEQAVRAAVVAYFGPEAGPVVDRLFESEWWQSAKGWAAEKAGEAIEWAGEQAEDLYEEVEEWVPWSTTIGGAPVDSETMKRFVIALSSLFKYLS